MDHPKNTSNSHLLLDMKNTGTYRIDTDKPVDLDTSEEDSSGLDNLHATKEDESTPNSLPELLSDSSSELDNSKNCSGNREGLLEVVAKASHKSLAAARARLIPSFPFGMSGYNGPFLIRLKQTEIINGKKKKKKKKS